MNTSRMSGRLTKASACAWVAILVSSAGYAADLGQPGSLKDVPEVAGDMTHCGNFATLPAGVSGAAMVCQGQFMAMYMPMYMDMQGNYIGSNTVSTATLLKTPNLTGGGPAYLRIIPSTMDADTNMFGLTYGVSDAINVMVMGNYVNKDMTMTTYNMRGTAVVGAQTNSTEGFGDTSIVSLLRVYEDGINHIHLSFGMSIPTGSTTEEMTMLSPAGTYMQHRAIYGMQIGSGTFDLLPGLTYTGAKNLWSWGAIYRARLPMNEDNGYHWGNLQQLTGWAGYTFLPGITATGRIAGTWQGRIEGSDPQIYGGMQGAYPGWYGGERVDLFGGIEIAGHQFGLGHTKLAIEAGLPVYQDLNGPQIGESWQLNAALGIMF